MARIIVDGQVAKLEADSETQERVYQALSVMDEEKRKVYAMKGLPYDPVRHFVSRPPNCAFSPGLAFRLAGMVGCPIEWKDELPEFRESPGTLNLQFDLWPEQRALIESFKPCRLGTWNAATNSGKTECFGVLCHETGLETAFLVNRTQLLYQTRDRLAKMLGENVGIIGDSKFSLERVTVTTVQTLDRALKNKGANAREIRSWWTRDVELLGADEGHNCSSGQYSRVLARCSATRRLMMSGTARTGHPIKDLELEALFGPVIGTISNREQVEKGRSSKMHVLCVPIRDPLMKSLNSEEARDRLVYRNTHRNRTLAAACAAGRNLGLGCIVATERRKGHIALLEAALCREGLNVELATGSESPERRNASLRRLSDGRIDVVLATTVLNEGINVPAVGVFVDAGTSRSVTRLLQQAGRVLRKKGVNVSFFVSPVDFTNPRLESISVRKMQMLEEQDCFEFHMVEPQDIAKIMAEILQRETGT